MNTKLKGVLQLLVILLVTAAVCVVAYTGIGGAKRGSAKNIRLGLDLAGGVSVTYEATKENPTAQEMKDTVYKMQMRVQNESTEASVYQEGNNRVTVDVPDVDDPQAVLDKLGKAGALEFVLYSNVTVGEDGKTATYDKKDVIIDGSMLKTAEAATQQDSTTGQTENVVKLSFNAKGTKKQSSNDKLSLKTLPAVETDRKSVVTEAPKTQVKTEQKTEPAPAQAVKLSANLRDVSSSVRLAGRIDPLESLNSVTVKVLSDVSLKITGSGKVLKEGSFKAGQTIKVMGIPPLRVSVADPSKIRVTYRGASVSVPRSSQVTFTLPQR